MMTAGGAAPLLDYGMASFSFDTQLQVKFLNGDTTSARQ
jgi:hypothetical protein